MSERTDGQQIYFNGINGTTGSYYTPPMTPRAMVRNVILGRPEAEAPEELHSLNLRKEYARGYWGLASGNPLKLDEAGWGIIFPASAPPELRAALQPLIDWRREQVGDRRFRVFEREQGYQPDQQKLAF